MLKKIWQKSRIWVRSFGTAVSMILFPILAYMMQESFVNSYEDLNGSLIFWFNVAFLYLFEFFIFILTFSPRWACAGTLLFSAAVGTAQFAVLSFRSLPICPWDLLSLGTALSVVGNYKLEITKEITTIYAWYAGLAVAAFLLCFGRITMKTHTRRKILLRVCFAVLCVVLTFGYVDKSQDEKFQSESGYYPYLFTPTVVYKRNGFYYSFASLLKYMDISEPNGYDADELAEVAEKYGASGTDEDESRPNVIIIMNESFSDLSVLGDFETTTDYMPYIRSLTENTVKGYAYVSVKGGNTPNSEWEFLTGDSMTFLPAGSIPYQQYMTDETPSFMSMLSEKGYTTYGIHPYNASGWKRNTVYPLLGIDNMIFSSEFKGMEKIREYYSDRSVYSKIIELYDRKADGERLGIFAVTMQNHGGYTNGTEFENFTPDVFVYGEEDSIPLFTYLSLVKKSDEAFEYLTERFEKEDEPTIILMFGDHQPNSTVTNPLYRLLEISSKTLEWDEKKEEYCVPFVIWANYDIEERDDVVTSLNYLNIYLSEAAGFELTGWQEYRKELMESYPVVTANFVIDSNGELFARDDFDPDDDEELLLYHRFQYNHMFDRKKLVENFY